MGSLSNWIGQHGISGEAVLGSAAILLAGAVIVLAANRALRRGLQHLQPRSGAPSASATRSNCCQKACAI
jgi:hypothetical protein